MAWAFAAGPAGEANWIYSPHQTQNWGCMVTSINCFAHRDVSISRILGILGMMGALRAVLQAKQSCSNAEHAFRNKSGRDEVSCCAFRWRERGAAYVSSFGRACHEQGLAG